MTGGLDPGFEARLAALASQEAGDWNDVRVRSQRIVARRRRRTVLGVALAALVLTTLSVVPALGIGDRVLGLLAISETQDRDVPSPPAPRSESPPAEERPVAHPYVFGRELVGLRGGTQKLGAEVVAPLLGHTRSIAVPSPDGRYVVYHTWRRETPSLRVHDVRTGRDVRLANGAQTFAWRRDGELAYWKALTPRYVSDAYMGHVVVQRSLEEPAVRWTTKPAEYGVVGWAGDRLLVHLHVCPFPGCGDPVLEGIYALDGPGEMQRLPLSSVTAISPDGKYAVGGFMAQPGDGGSSVVRVVEVATGRVVVHINRLRSADRSVPKAWFTGGVQEGSWARDQIVATLGAGEVSAVVFLHFDGRTLSVEKVLRLVEKTEIDLGLGPFFSTPTFVNRAGRLVTVEVHTYTPDEADGISVFLTCDRITSECVQGKELPLTRWLALVQNPSRPVRNGGFLPKG
jgi:hypothetical protein